MLSKERNDFESEGWILTKLREFSSLSSFDCGRPDLNEFFREDCKAQKEELLCEVYVLKESTAENFYPAALVGLSNDAVRREKVKEFLRFTSPKKKYPSYPAVKIARLGVNSQVQSGGIGTHLINMIKTMFVTNNRTGCRFLTVDAYNDDWAINFYLKNEFDFFSKKDKNKRHRAMYFDLKRLVL